MQLRRLKPLLGLACGLGVVGAPADAAPEKMRVDVYVLQYSTPGGSDNHPYLRQTIEDRLALLRTEIRTRSRGAAYLSGMHVFPKPAVTASSDVELMQLWNRERALLLMWGRVEPGKQNMVAISSLYLGDLASQPLNKIELAKINLSASNDPQIRDTHSLVVGFALLLDAQRKGVPRDTLAAILATVYNIYERVRVSAYRPPELAQIKASLDRIGAGLRAR